jgi:hypothetical protein
VTTPSATALQPARAPRIAWLPVALVFIVGTTIGAIAAASAINFSQTDGTDVPAAVVPNAELGRLLGNMDAAAARGEARLLLAWRQDLVELIGAARVAEYEAVRGVDAPINWVDPTRHLKQRNQPPTFHESDNSGGI